MALNTTQPVPHPSRRPWMQDSWHYWITMQGPRPGPWWMQWIWTALFSAVVALAFTAVGFGLGDLPASAWLDLRLWARWFGINLVITGTIAVLIQLLFGMLNSAMRDPRAARWKRWPHGAYHVAIPALGVLLGWPLGVWLVQDALPPSLRWSAAPSATLGMLPFALVVALLLHQWFEARALRIEAEREAAEAQLRLLQGQIEPHFLFNTLANVSSLMETDVPRARSMLDSFVDYLRSSLQGLRDAEQTLVEELALVDAYLKVQSARMEGRLHHHIDVPETLRARRLPTLLLQPLVENAVVHGIEPSLEGGRVRITARESATHVELQVEDDGVGLAGPRRNAASSQAAAKRGQVPGGGSHGLALRNIRERLARQFGDDARLDVEPRTGGGVVATLRLPRSATERPA